MKTHAYNPVRPLLAALIVEEDPCLWAPAWELPGRGPARRLQEDPDDEG